MNSFRYHVRFLRWHLGHTIPMIMRHASTYPELPRKTALRRWLDNMYLYIRDGSPCAGYDGLGLDIKKRPLDDFVSNHYWMKFLNTKIGLAKHGQLTPAETLKLPACSPLFVLQNKQCFWSTLDRYGIPVVPVLAHSIGGILYEFAGRPLASYDRLFVKPVDGECGKASGVLIQRNGVFYDGEKRVELSDYAKNDQSFIFQPVVENHPQIKALNPTTLNTLRIVTCRNLKGEYVLWDPGMIRIGRSNAVVDNFAKGGIGVGIAEGGKLKRYGYSHDQDLNYTKIERHPDTQLLFDEYEIPFYKESVELVKKTHSLFPFLQTIGWDVAVTSGGPILVEGNQRWDIEMLQVVHHKGYASRLREIYGDM